jgi:hypothetical protein
MPQTDIEIVNSLDQPIQLPIQEAMKQVDQIIQQAISFQDVNILINEAEMCLQQTRISGLALCKLLYKANSMWDYVTGTDTPDFIDTVSTRLGLSKTTIDRYMSVWSVYELHQIPANLSDDFLQKPLRSQIPVAKLIEQGYSPNQEQWQQLADAPDLSTTTKLIRDIKETEPRKSAMMLFIDKNGNLTAVQDVKIADLGWLNVALLEDGLVSKAIKRIVNDARILEKNG